jgi:hypothetical protein
MKIAVISAAVVLWIVGSYPAQIVHVCGQFLTYIPRFPKKNINRLM